MLFCDGMQKNRHLKIGFVGSGNAASTIIPLLSANAEVHLYARDKKFIEGSMACDKIEDLFDCSIVILAVNDGSIESLVPVFSDYQGILAHLSGVSPLPNHSNGAVMWPLQNLTSSSKLNGSPIFYECVNHNDEKIILEIASLLEANAVKSTLEFRHKMHLCAVLSHNFSNHLIAQSEEIIGVDNTKHLIPILREMIRKLEHDSAAKIQTGPALRHDESTIQRHLELLDSNKDLSEIYTLLSKSIQKYHEKL